MTDTQIKDFPEIPDVNPKEALFLAKQYSKYVTNLPESEKPKTIEEYFYSEYQELKRTCPKCGCKEFYGNRVIYASAVLNGSGDYKRYEKGTLEESIFDHAVEPGPYFCMECGKEYESLPPVQFNKEG